MAIEAKADVVVDNLSNDEVLELLRAFGAEPVGEPVRLFGGYASSNFKVTAKVDGGESKPYLLKVNYYGLNLEDIEHQLFVMNRLRKSSFPTNYPYPSKSGAFYEVKGGRTAILLDFITGKRGDEMLAADEGKSEKLLQELAAALAQLHQVSWPSDKKLRDIRAGYPLCNTGDLLRGEPRTMASAAGIPTWENVYINGQRRWWSRPASPEKFCDVIDSNTGKVCARVPAGGAKDVEKAVAAAREAFPSWAEKPLDERKAILLKVLEKWQGKKAQATEWLCKELGCTTAFAKNVQVNMVDFHLGTCLKLVDMVKFEERMAFGSLVVREPIGVVGCITPWNYPLNQIAAKVFPAMLVGCTIVLKPSEVTPVCAYLLAEAVHEAGVPAGVFNMLMGDGPNCGEAIAAHPGVDMVSFTGSTRAGKRISEVGAQTLKVVRTELGGKSAALLLEDADLPKLVPKFMQTLMNNSGQSCNALSRMLVPRSRYDEAVGIAKQVAEQTTVSFAQDDKDKSCCVTHGVCAATCPPIDAYAAAAAGFASPDDCRTFPDPFVGAMASSRIDLAAALEVVRSAVADGDDLAPLFCVWSGLERQAITKAVANSAVTAGAMPSTAPTGSSSGMAACCGSADPRPEPPTSSDHAPPSAQRGAAARTVPTRWAHRAVGGQAKPSAPPPLAVQAADGSTTYKGRRVVLLGPCHCYQHALHLEAESNNLVQRLRMEHAYATASCYPDAGELAAIWEYTLLGLSTSLWIDFVIARRQHADGMAAWPGEPDLCSRSQLATSPFHFTRDGPASGFDILALDQEARMGGRYSLPQADHTACLQDGRHARRDLLNRELAQAVEAAQRHDKGQLHRIIRRLAELLRDSEEH
ncbi:ald, partial [Symbiodinium sp. CCMP2456]